MASIYDKIMSAKELLDEVKVHGISTKTEDICRVQDIFGHSAVEELVALANDNGMNGSWSTGRSGTQAIFYQVLFIIWNWEDATRFYNQHTNPERKELTELRKKLSDEMEEHKKTIHSYEDVMKNAFTLSAQVAELEAKIQKMKEAREADKLAIMELKAKLYDMMMEGKA